MALTKTTKEKGPHPIFIPFEQGCPKTNKKKFSREAIMQVQESHSKWLKKPSTPDGARANLCEADLTGAEFNMAMLAGANFSHAILHNAKLQKTNLTRANFKKAQLQNASLNEAMLHMAIFQESNLDGASLEGAMLFQANLRGVDLSKVKGLTQPQIDMACTDKATKLPPKLSRPKPCS